MTRKDCPFDDICCRTCAEVQMMTRSCDPCDQNCEECGTSDTTALQNR